MPDTDAPLPPCPLCKAQPTTTRWHKLLYQVTCIGTDVWEKHEVSTFGMTAFDAEFRWRRAYGQRAEGPGKNALKDGEHE